MNKTLTVGETDRLLLPLVGATFALDAADVLAAAKVMLWCALERDELVIDRTTGRPDCPEGFQAFCSSGCSNICETPWQALRGLCEELGL